jgi:hypothetical protein
MALAALAILASNATTFPLDTQTNTTPEKPKGASADAASGPSQADPQEAEAKFKALLANATLSGRWCMVADGRLGEDKEDNYTIVDVQKVGGDSWIIRAHVKYGDSDFVAPIPVKVKWAGDTPVLMVDKLTVPGGGTYSARVMFYENTYSGTWTAGTRGGLLHGTISNQKQ